MQLNITGHHVEITPALRAYATEKIQRISRHFDQVISISLILNVEKLQKTAEGTINTSGRTLFATETDMDMYAAIDGLMDKLDKQVRRHKDRKSAHNHVNPDKAASSL